MVDRPDKVKGSLHNQNSKRQYFQQANNIYEVARL